MSNQPPPTTIPELWYVLDKRLALFETDILKATEDRNRIYKVLDDHEKRIRTGLTFTAITTGSGSLLALIAIIKSFLLP